MRQDRNGGDGWVGSGKSRLGVQPGEVAVVGGVVGGRRPGVAGVVEVVDGRLDVGRLVRGDV